MNALRCVGVAAALTVAAVLQMTLASALSLGPARPDILLTTLVCAGLLWDLPLGSAAGIWAGILMATIVGVNYGSFLVSRTIAGTATGWLAERGLREEIAIPPMVAFAATVICESIYYAMAPAHRGIWWAEHVILEAAYNAALAGPIWLILRRIGLRRVEPA